MNDPDAGTDLNRVLEELLEDAGRAATALDAEGLQAKAQALEAWMGTAKEQGLEPDAIDNARRALLRFRATCTLVANSLEEALTGAIARHAPRYDKSGELRPIDGQRPNLRTWG